MDISIGMIIIPRTFCPVHVLLPINHDFYCNVLCWKFCIQIYLASDSTPRHIIVLVKGNIQINVFIFRKIRSHQ